MRRFQFAILGGCAAVSGCLAPFSWPEDRHAVVAVPIAVPMSVPVAAPAEVPVAVASSADHLRLAAEFLDKGDDAGALPHLEAHVSANPNAVMMRAYFAELLMRQDRTTAAVQQFERVVVDAQRETGAARAHLVHCHTRLMELAEEHGDRYAEELHRGIGLLLLVQRWDGDLDRQDEAAAERTLVKAVSSLKVALIEQPGDVRANLYLAEVYERLGQSSAARSARTALANQSLDGLTPAERDRLALAK